MSLLRADRIVSAAGSGCRQAAFAGYSNTGRSSMKSDEQDFASGSRTNQAGTNKLARTASPGPWSDGLV